MVRYSHESNLIRQIASYGIFHARSASLLGQNMLFCIDRYRSPVNSLLYSSFNIINSYFNSTVDSAQSRTCSFLSELIEIRDSRENFSNNFILSYAELCDIFTYISTC